jgi:hypothetical protein
VGTYGSMVTANPRSVQMVTASPCSVPECSKLTSHDSDIGGNISSEMKNSCSNTGLAPSSHQVRSNRAQHHNPILEVLYAL